MWPRRRGAVDSIGTEDVAVGIPAPPLDDSLVTEAAPAGAMDMLDRRLAAVEERLTTAAGGRSLCELSRDGGSVGLKELEGRMSALAEARRAARRSIEAPEAVIEAVLDAWRAEFVNDSDRGVAWRSYRSGGIDELESLLNSLDHRDPTLAPFTSASIVP